MIEIYFDGLCEPINPGGVACYGYILRRNGTEIKSQNGVIGEGNGMTNNLAEFTALKLALEDLILNHVIYRHETVKIRGDSQLVINQCSGRWRIKSDTSKKFAPKIRQIVDQIEEKGGEVSFTWIPRIYNNEADQLTKEAYRLHALKNGGKIKL